MDKKSPLLLCGALLYFFILGPAFAQEKEIQQPPPFDLDAVDRAWEETIAGVMDSIETLTKENDRLAEKKKKLCGVFLSLLI